MLLKVFFSPNITITLTNKNKDSPKHYVFTLLYIVLTDLYIKPGYTFPH